MDSCGAMEWHVLAVWRKGCCSHRDMVDKLLAITASTPALLRGLFVWLFVYEEPHGCLSFLSTTVAKPTRHLPPPQSPPWHSADDWLGPALSWTMKRRPCFMLLALMCWKNGAL